MYVKLNNGAIEKFPYSIGDLRKENPNISFPRILSDEILAQFGVAPVTEQNKPDTDQFSYAVKRHLPELVDGRWVVLWDVVQKTAEAIAEEDERQATAIRDSRNGKLTATDWTQVSDAPVDKTAWANYRQALRDIPSQQGFPWDVTWPDQPE
jgi:hypothetical protein